MIILYQKINGNKTYQLKSKLSFNNNYFFIFTDILKIDKKSIIIYSALNFFLINIQTMKIIQKFIVNNKDDLEYEKIKIKFIYKLDNKIYVFFSYWTYILKYLNNKFFLICKVHLTDIFIFYYLLNVNVEKNFPKSKIKMFFFKERSKEVNPQTLLMIPRPSSYFNIAHSFRIIKLYNKFFPKTFIREMKYLNKMIYKEQKNNYIQNFLIN